MFCKSILYEFAVKTKTARPLYSEECLKEPFTLFVGSVVFDGNTYTGEPAPNKKDAQQNAARAVIKSVLGILCSLDHDLKSSTDESVGFSIHHLTNSSICCLQLQVTLV